MTKASTAEIAEIGQERAFKYIEMEVKVKELVNILLPACYIVQSMELKAAPIEGSSNVAVRRDELDSLIHLIGHAHVVAEQLQAIMKAAKLTGEEAASRDDASANQEMRPREAVRAQDARFPDSRPREEGWRKEARELARPSKIA